MRVSAVASSPVRDLLALVDRPEVISFAGGLPAPEMFDVPGWRAAFDAALSGPAARRHLQYAPTEGDPRLRELVAARMAGRGLATGAGDLLVTTGSQQGLTLVAAALLEPGSTVVVQEPTYLAALQCFAMAGARVVSVPSDEQGVDPAALAEVLVRERPALVYLVPTFANPTGATMSAARRAQVAAVAAGHEVWIVEDDPYGELRYRGTPLAPLTTYGDRGIYLGSLSKIGAPGLRLGWVRTPAALRSALVIAKQAADLHTSTIDQAAAAAYLAATDLDDHVRRLCDGYRLRRDTMLAGLQGITPGGTSWTDPDGGMFVWVRLPEGTDTTALLPVALRHDVAFVPGAPFYAGRPDPATLRLSFTTGTPEQITEGLGRLGRAIDAAFDMLAGSDT
ncbi:transcriptional regulator [Actinoplanes sp. SE50]|uniref:aminotransferase-like domain-containing protein n=1 Tax=unclassified Actinoplanes TaxID=2626549 RepID=UPI00023EC10A|nr:MULTISPECIES: PLP-dependent aminotransferase family protein [unclassified Actinoplanes]AEV85193.1 putative transcriptional regulator, GntR family [Actinoplanes sp. SE50/110]ATO83588.1 transcriptional regulator [Actinoplanes sp. SE50]SLM00995.1 transcriptional regulator [Actinoplanes sp. SE50/110]